MRTSARDDKLKRISSLITNTVGSEVDDSLWKQNHGWEVTIHSAREIKMLGHIGQCYHSEEDLPNWVKPTNGLYN
jgi:hypothetical protein